MGVNKRPAEEMSISSESEAQDTPTKDPSAAIDCEEEGECAPSSAKKAKKASPKKKKKTTAGLSFPLQPKNPVALLNELRQSLTFSLVSQTGPVHAPVFTMNVVVDGCEFVGEGRSKKQAKIVAAKNALTKILNQHAQFEAEKEMLAEPYRAVEYNRGIVEVDFTSDDPADANFIITQMNRIQTKTTSNPFPDTQIPLHTTTGPLTALPGNGIMKPPSSIKAGNEGEELVDLRRDREDHEDSGHLELDFVVKEEPRSDGEGSEYDSGRDDEDVDEGVDSEEEEVVELTPNILDLIRISVEFYEDYDLEVQNAAKNKLIVPEKGPVMLLYELFSDIQFECVQTDGGQFSRFKMRVKVNEEVFEGTGPSKRLAKTAAAKAALAQLRNISYSPMQSRNAVPNELNSIETESFGAELPQQLADGIGKMIQDKFAELMVGQEIYAKRKVLAGIVMTENGQLENAKVISVSTGTKCINGEHISIIGAVVNDCHAEIISRRCLMVFLYSQLRLLFSEETKSSSIFEDCPEQPEFYQLKAGIEFHLYINTAPCGDARIFSPHDAENNNVDKHPNRKARGQLRTKIESGEGTIPAKNNSGVQTWDGVIQGQRLLTMSCSDKIAKWNVMGIQGSLLASIIKKPIYLASIVLGSLLHPAHMYRAVCGRIEGAVTDLPPPYYLNRPKLALVTSAEVRNQLKAPNFSVNWSYGDEKVEIINSITGKTIHSQDSRISKRNFIVRYMSAVQHLKSNPPKMESDYGELKASVKDYQQVKDQLYKAFIKEDLGMWLKKPVEQDQFTVQN